MASSCNKHCHTVPLLHLLNKYAYIIYLQLEFVCYYTLKECFCLCICYLLLDSIEAVQALPPAPLPSRPSPYTAKPCPPQPPPLSVTIAAICIVVGGMIVFAAVAVAVIAFIGILIRRKWIPRMEVYSGTYTYI